MKLRRPAGIRRVANGKSQIKAQRHSHYHYPQTKAPVVMPTLKPITREKLKVPRPQKTAIIEECKTQGIRNLESVLRT